MAHSAAGHQRPSSAGYRLPAAGGATRGRSGGHAGAAKGAAVGAAVPAGGSRRTGSEGDRVTWERVWTESVEREQRGALTWKKKWSFLTNYNERGELVFPDDPESNPESESSGEGERGTPTASGHRHPYLTTAQLGPGSGVSSQSGRELSRLDHALSPHHHKRRLPSEMVPC